VATLHVKEFDEELLARLKSGAALKRLTLKQHLENIVRASVGVERKRVN
jgi:hypothetical protein